MKITDLDPKPLRLFMDIPTGCVFKYHDTVYIKTKAYTYDCIIWNCVNLHNGERYSLTDCAEVEYLPNAELKV